MVLIFQHFILTTISIFLFGSILKASLSVLCKFPQFRRISQRSFKESFMFQFSSGRWIIPRQMVREFSSTYIGALAEVLDEGVFPDE